MISFVLSLVALVLGYIFYGRFLERTVFGSDRRPTPALTMADGVDYVVMPGWKIFMIQFLNIAGTGPIFGAIMGAKFGPVAYLWIVLGCIFAGAMHDYLSGMISLRRRGAGLPELIGHYLGKRTKGVMLVFSVVLLLMVGVVFVYSPAEILGNIWGGSMVWIVVIFIYYVIATMLPIDKIIGKIYPVFAFALLFMAVALGAYLFIHHPSLPEVWDGLGNMAKAHDSSFTDEIFPCLFITVACGAISGFHATQSPLMARCMKSESQGRPIFYGAMITEGVVALIWATISSYFFYGSPTPASELIEGASATGFHTSTPMVVNLVCNDWLGVAGGILALLGVVAAPITSGDTAFRSCRLIVADALNLEQHSLSRRLLVSVPIFVIAVVMLIVQMGNPDGFNVVWQYFGWANQTLSVFTLWMLTVYMVRHKKPYIITLVPALFMTTVCSTFIFVSPQAIGMPLMMGYGCGAAVLIISLVWFFGWLKRYRRQPQTEDNEWD